MDTKEENTADCKLPVPGLQRGMRILEHLAGERTGKTVMELSSELGYPFSSVSRMAQQLERMGYLSRDPKSKTFVVTMKMLEIGQRSICASDVLERSLPVMRLLRDELEDTVALGVLRQGKVTVVESVPGTRPFTFALNPGFTAEIHVSAPGKAMLAHYPTRQRNAVVEAMPFTRYNERTITSRTEFMAELDAAAKRGYAFDDAEEYDGIYCIGAPVFDRTSFPVAAIWVTGPSGRITKEQMPEIGEKIRSAANEISAALGSKRRA